MDGLWCGGVLMYELVWKRRSSIAKSSVVSKFTAVALKTSALTCASLSASSNGDSASGYFADEALLPLVTTVLPGLVALAAAICITISFRHVNTAAFHAFLLIVSALPYASSSCAIFSQCSSSTPVSRSACASSLRTDCTQPSSTATPCATRSTARPGPARSPCRPALRDPDQAARRRALHVDSDGLLYTEAPPLHKFKRESADGDPYSQAERAADAVGRRVLTLPTPLSFLPCGSGHGAEGRSHRKARRQSEMDERASRTSGVSVVVDIVVTEEQCEELPCRAEDDFSFEEDPGSSGSQGSGSPKGRTHEEP